MSAAPTVAPDQFVERPRAELEAMCAIRGLTVSATDDAGELRRRLRADLNTRRGQDTGRFARPQVAVADRDSAARMALIDGEVRAHFATQPLPATSRAIAQALRRNQQEVLLSVQRLGCPRLTGGLYGPPSATPTEETL